MTQAEFAIECVQLVKLYRRAGLESLALQGLDLTVRRGEILGLVGASGSGKSTLLNILGGLDQPTAGRAWVAGEDLLRLAGRRLDRFRRSRVGFVWQQSARNLLPQLTAQENVELPQLLAGHLGRSSRGRVRELLAAVGLTARRQHHPHQLSGGEQQRLGIAVAMANQPDVLLADEPTGELDSEAAGSVFAVFKALNRLYGQTILIVSHDPGLAGHVPRAIAIRDGRTASETVLIPASEAQAGAFEERVVVDAAGRLQLPKEYVERYRLHPRALLTAMADGLLLHAASEPAAAPQPAPAQMERKRHWWQGRRRDEDREDAQ